MTTSLVRRTSAALAAAGVTLFAAGSASATDCTVNVLSAYQVAVQRGWQFSCGLYEGGIAHAGVKRSFVTYPPDKIGCAFTTPIVWTSDHVGRAHLFKSGSGAPPDLKNGWRVASTEVSGVQWSNSTHSSQARVQFAAKGDQPGKTYNARLSKLVLRKDGGSCAKAIDEAF